MARTVDTSSTFEQWRQNYNTLATEVGDPASLTTADKTSLVNAVNYIMDQYFFFQDFDFDGVDGDTSNTVFPGAAMNGLDNTGNTFLYKPQKLLVYKNGLLLRSGTDYTAVNGTTFTLAASANDADVIRVSSYTGSYTNTPAGAESQFYWQTAGSNIFNRNSAGIVLQTGRAIASIVTAPTVADSIQLDGDTYVNADLYLNAQKDLRFRDSDSSHYVAVQAPGTVSTNRTLTLPSAEDGYMIAVAAVGTNGQVLSSDGDGSYSWTNVSNTNTTYTTSWVDSSSDAILRLTPSTGSADDLTIVAGTGITVTPSGDNLTIAATASLPTNITVADTTDTSAYVALFESATGDLAPKTDAGLTYNAGTGMLTATGFTGPLTGSATSLATGRTIAMTGDVTYTSGSFDGTGNVTGSGTIANAAVNTAKIQNDAINGTKIADNAIDSEHYVDGSIDTAHIGNDQITNAHIADGAIDLPAKLATGVVQIAKIDPSLIQLSSESFADNNTSLMTSAAIADKIESYNYTTDTGDITGVTAGTGLSGGGTSGTVTLAFDASELTDMTQGWTTAQDEFVVLDNGTTKRKLSSEIFGSNAFNSTAFTTNAGTVTGVTGTAPVVSSGGTAPAISVTTAAIADSGTGLATADQIHTFVTGFGYTTNTGTTTASNTQTFTNKTWNGTAIASGYIANDAIDSNHYADRSIDTAHISLLAVGAAEIATDAINGSKIADDVVDSEHYAADSIDTEHYAAGSVDTTALGANCVTAAKIGDNVINSEHYAAGSIDNEHLANDAVTQFVVADGSAAQTYYPLFVGSATGNLLPKTGSNLTFNGDTGTLAPTILSATTITASGDITSNTSDARLKDVIGIIENPLEKLSKINGYDFTWNETAKSLEKNTFDDEPQIGVMAQEIEEILPSVVKPSAFEGYNTVQYEKIVPLLIESIKELQREVESLKDSKT